MPQLQHCSGGWLQRPDLRPGGVLRPQMAAAVLAEEASVGAGLHGGKRAAAGQAGEYRRHSRVQATAAPASAAAAAAGAAAAGCEALNGQY